MDAALEQPLPVEGEVDVVNAVKSDLVSIRAGREINPEQYRMLIMLAAEVRVTLDDNADQTIDQVLSKIEQDLEKRAEKGVETYGKRLQTKNGRDPLLDAYQELLDLLNYFKQCLLEKRF
jgi:hypothetical protein